MFTRICNFKYSSLLELLLAPLSFSFWIVANLLCCCLHLFDAIIELHPLKKKAFIKFLIGKSKWIVYVVKAYIFRGSYFVYVEEAFMTLNSKAWYKYMSPFCSLPLVCINLFFSIIYLYIEDLIFIVKHARPLGL